MEALNNKMQRATQSKALWLNIGPRLDGDLRTKTERPIPHTSLQKSISAKFKIPSNPDFFFYIMEEGQTERCRAVRDNRALGKLWTK